MAVTDLFSFVVGMPAYRFGLTQHLYQAFRDLDLPRRNEIFISETSTVKARNFITGIFLRDFAYSGSNVLVMIDQDTVATAADIQRLVLQCDEINPIVSAHVCYRNRPENANWFFSDDPEFAKKEAFLQAGKPETDRLYVDRCGFGLIALHKSALIKMADNAQLIVTGTHYSPDLFSSITEKVESNQGFELVQLPETFSFCKRAKALNIPIMVDLSVRPGHIEESIRYMTLPGLA